MKDEVETKTTFRIVMDIKIGLIVLLIILLVGIIFSITLLNMFKKSGAGQILNTAIDVIRYNEQQEQKKQAMIDKQNECLRKIVGIDTNFSIDEFKDLVNQCMVEYFKALSFDDQYSIEKLRNKASERFIKDYIEEVTNIKKQYKHRYDSIYVKEMLVDEVLVYQNQLQIVCKVVVTYTKKEFDEANVMKKLKQYHQMFKIKMIKENNHEQVMVKMNCPNCGAAIDVVKDSKCPYCKSVIYKKINIWLLDDVTKLIDDVR